MAVIHFNLSTDPADYKAPNKKGVRHHKHCFNDEPGVTVCVCEPIRPREQSPCPVPIR